MVYHFEKSVVTVAEDPIVKLHDRATPEIRLPILFLVMHDIRKNFVEECREVLRRLVCFSRLLGEIFEHRPRVDEGTPVDIAQVRQE